MALTEGTLTPAYGKDYTTGKAAKEAFLEGKDFVFNNIFHNDDGRYCSIRDFKPGQTVQIRYKQKTKSVIAKVPSDYKG